MLVNPWGDVRTFHELSTLREAVANVRDDDSPAVLGPESDPSPLSGRDLEVLAAPSAPAVSEAPPSVPAALPPMRPRLKSMPPPLPFKLSPSLQPPMQDPTGSQAPHPPTVSVAPEVEEESAFALGLRPRAAQPFAVSQSLQPPMAPAFSDMTGGPPPDPSFASGAPPRPSVGFPDASSPDEVTKRTSRPRLPAPSEPVDASTFVQAAPSRSALVGGAAGLGVAILAVGVYVLMSPRSEDTGAPAVTVVAAHALPSDVATAANPAPLTPRSASDWAAAAPSSSAAGVTAVPGTASSGSVSPPATAAAPSSPATAAPPATAPAAPATATPTPAAAVLAAAPVAAPPSPAPAESAGPPQSAAAIRRARDLGRAEAKYRALVSSNPRDVESLAFLGDTLLALGKPTEALTMYERALSFSPGYQPALLGLADGLWVTGDHAGASKRYAEVVDRFPAEAVPARARERVAP